MAMNFDEALAGLHDNSQLFDFNSASIVINDKREFIIKDDVNTILAYSGDVNNEAIIFTIPFDTYQDEHDLSLCQYKKVKWKNLTSGFEGASN